MFNVTSLLFAGVREKELGYVIETDIVEGGKTLIIEYARSGVNMLIFKITCAKSTYATHSIN